ncbi:hypothetical protein K438DRAFT_923907 [Mycena galopus ATCC 62051]|nr:hypothetical protein K438DRAFT_923907 [Mycena galopus ATCC 62051]
MMSPGGYPFPPGPSNSIVIPPRRPSCAMPLSYDRPVATLPPHRSPSPGSLRRYPYDDYPASRPVPPYRDYFGAPQQKSFPPDSHRYPSPPRSYGSERVFNDPWDPPPRQPPNNSPWPDRRAVTQSPTSPVISRDRVRSDPPRMFEPSNAWKQTQGDRPISVHRCIVLAQIQLPLNDTGGTFGILPLLKEPGNSSAVAPHRISPGVIAIARIKIMDAAPAMAE